MKVETERYYGYGGQAQGHSYRTVKRPHNQPFDVDDDNGLIEVDWDAGEFPTWRMNHEQARALAEAILLLLDGETKQD